MFHLGPLALPSSYRHLVSDARFFEALPKPNIDCNQCRRVAEGTAEPNTKCCDIVPRLPNFLVGELLGTTQATIIKTWIASRRGDPFGLQVPPVLAERYRAARKDGAFGLPCPLLEAGRCTIYAYRPLSCVDYHCYYPDLLTREAYACALSTLMALERNAERRLVLHLGLDATRLAKALETPEAQLWDGPSQRQEPYADLWQHWQGREEAYYRACFEALCEEAAGPPVHLDVSPVPPTLELRSQYRTAAEPAHRNSLRMDMQLSMLRWYLDRLNGPAQRLRRWLRIL